MKSLPASAVPGVVVQLTVDVIDRLPVRVTVNVTVTAGRPLSLSVTVVLLMLRIAPGGGSLSVIVPVAEKGDADACIRRRRSS